MRTASARTLAWITFGYAAALVLLLLMSQFLIANNLAVSRTFFLLPLIQSSFFLILRAFWINIYIFLIAEVLVLIWGLVVALARLAPGPAGRPIRMIATFYVDVFRGLPAIINIYLIGFGIPLTGLPFLKDLSQESFAILALTLTNGAYVAEVYRAGIESIHWSQTAAARSLGLSHMQTLRYVIIPQGVRQIIPPLLNNFIGLQKDTALVNVIGTHRCVQPVDHHRQQQLQSVAGDDGGGSVHPDHHPAGAPGGPDDRARSAAHARRRQLRASYGADRDPRHPQAFRCAHGVQRPGARGGGASGGLPDRPFRLRQIDLAALHQRPGDIDGGEICISGDRMTGPGVDVNALRREVGIVFQSFNLFPHMTVLENVMLAPMRVLRQDRAEAEAGAMALLKTDRAGAQGEGISRPAVRRTAAARRDRAGAGDGAAGDAAGRDHVRAGP